MKNYVLVGKKEMSEKGKLESEQPLKEQIRYNFDCSSDKNLLLQDMYRLVDVLVAKIQAKIDKYKKMLVDRHWWASTFEAFKKEYDSDFPWSDNHGDTEEVASLMSAIEDLEDVLKMIVSPKVAQEKTT